MKSLEWTDLPRPLVWREAMNVGTDGWRLPTKYELLELYDSGEMPAAKVFWSASTCVADPTHAWLVIFYGGGTYYKGYKTNEYYVRMVRDKQEELVQGGIKMKTNIKTKNKEWHQADSIMSFNDARKYCKTLGKGWKIPTVDELLTLSEHSIKLKALVWTLTSTWSSTLTGSNSYYNVSLVDGHVYSDVDTCFFYVTCVRKLSKPIGESPSEQQRLFSGSQNN